ncbi:MAG: DUF2837 family protein [Firmicutes bacterium]|nr:DUF2837 family protein [Bacillota bacterium]
MLIPAGSAEAERLLLICLLTGVIHMVETLSYSARIAGIRTRRLYLAASLFSVLVLLARTANLVQAPLLGYFVDETILSGNTALLAEAIRGILLSATLGSLLAASLIPTFIHIFIYLTGLLEKSESMGVMLLRLINTDNFFKKIHHRLEKSVRRPRLSHLLLLKDRVFVKRILLLTILVASINTTGVLSAIYAGALVPDYRLTASQMSGVLNGFSTVLLTFFIDPYASLITDQVMAGKRKPWELNAMVTCLVTGKILGTLLGQLIFLPCSQFVILATELMQKLW